MNVFKDDDQVFRTKLDCVTENQIPELERKTGLKFEIVAKKCDFCGIILPKEHVSLKCELCPTIFDDCGLHRRFTCHNDHLLCDLEIEKINPKILDSIEPIVYRFVTISIYQGRMLRNYIKEGINNRPELEENDEEQGPIRIIEIKNKYNLYELEYEDREKLLKLYDYLSKNWKFEMFLHKTSFWTIVEIKMYHKKN